MPKEPAYRNKLEEKVATQVGPEFTYETCRLPYMLTHHYKPDFIDEAAKTIVEAKGLFTAEDRRKHIAIRDQYPDWTVEIVFQNPDRKLSKASATSYGEWCTKNNIAWRKA